MQKLWFVALVALWPTTALAHSGDGALSGFFHPLAGLDHVLAMVAVGVWAIVLGGRAIWLVPLTFVCAMVVGFLIGVAGLDLPFVELGIGLSTVVIGFAAALGRPAPVAGAMGLVGLFAIFHGQAHGFEMPSGSSSLGNVVGFVAATGLLHAVALVATVALTGAAVLVGLI